MVSESIVVETDIPAHISTQSYYISKRWPYTDITATPKGGGSLKKFTFERTSYPQNFFPVMYYDALISSVGKRGDRNVFELSYINLETETVTPFSVLPLNGTISIANDKKYIYLGSNRDLHIYDLLSLRRYRVLEDFISVDADDKFLRHSQMVRLIIDQDRLIALTRNGEKSRVVPLDEIVGAQRHLPE